MVDADMSSAPTAGPRTTPAQASAPAGHRARQEGQPAVEEDGGAEHGPDQVGAGQGEFVTEPLLEHGARRHQGQRQNQTDPEAPAEDLRVVMPCVRVVLGVRCAVVVRVVLRARCAVVLVRVVLRVPRAVVMVRVRLPGSPALGHGANSSRGTDSCRAHARSGPPPGRALRAHGGFPRTHGDTAPGTTKAALPSPEERPATCDEAGRDDRI